jgi:hypothetical protein
VNFHGADQNPGSLMSQQRPVVPPYIPTAESLCVRQFRLHKGRRDPYFRGQFCVSAQVEASWLARMLIVEG